MLLSSAREAWVLSGRPGLREGGPGPRGDVDRFFNDGMEGPLTDGQSERVKDLGARLASAAQGDWARPELATGGEMRTPLEPEGP